MSEQSASSTARRVEYLNIVSDRGYFIYGSGGHAQVVEDFFPHDTLLACVTDDWASESMAPWKDMVFGPDEIPNQSRVIVAIGDNYAREKVSQRLINAGKSLIFPNVEHSSAQISGRAGVGMGGMRCANSVVIAGTLLGDFVIINTGATVDHDCYLGDYVHIAPGVNLCGNVKVGDRTIIGVGSCARPKVTIGKDSIIGAGSVIINDIPSGVVAYGNPCKIIKEIS